MGVVRNAVAVLLLPLCLGYTRALAGPAGAFMAVRPRTLSFLVGAAALLAYRRLAARLDMQRSQRFADTLEHELTHSLVAWLLGSEVTELKATSDAGGHVSHTHSNVLITLAPYFLPTFTVAVLLAAPFIKDEYALGMVFLAGFTFCFHLVSTWHELSLRQPDIQRSGPLFALVFIWLMNAVFLGAVLSFVVGGDGAVPAFLRAGLERTWALLVRLRGLAG